MLPYGECVIHGEIYKARPDVNAVCHHHSVAILPFCITGMALQPMFGLGAVMGAKVPFWDSRDEFGDTPMVLTTGEQGASLARALGPHCDGADAPPRRHGGRQWHSGNRIPLHSHASQRRAAIAFGGAWARFRR